jgi:hypothetical protein
MRSALTAVAVASLLAATLCAAPAQAAPGDAATIPDTAFRACLNKALGQASTATITQAQLAGLTEVTCDHNATGVIESLAGAEYLTGLTKLFVGGSRLTTLAPLKTLTGLTSLDIFHNNFVALSDLTPLSGLTKLTDLQVADATVTDLSPLKTLTRLTTLSLVYNRIADLAPLKTLTQLTALDLWGNRVSDVAPLTSLTKLETLDLRSNNITDVAPLAAFAPATGQSQLVLWLDDNHITDLAALGSGFAPMCGGLRDCGDKLTGVNAGAQRATATAKPGDVVQPIKPLADGAITVVVRSGDATVDAANTVTFGRAGTVVLDWRLPYTDMGDYFSGTLTVTVSDPATPAQCGVTRKVPLAGPNGTFLDVVTATPHADDINWLAANGWSQGWSVSCYKTTEVAAHVITGGAGYTLSSGRYDANYGVLTDPVFASNQGTLGYVFQPEAAVTRADAAVWLAKLALDDTAVDLTKPDTLTDYLDGQYSLTNTAWTQGADKKWGTDDDAKAVTIPVGHDWFVLFGDFPANLFAVSSDRQALATAWLANTVVNAKFDESGRLITGQRLAEGFAAAPLSSVGFWCLADTLAPCDRAGRDFRPYTPIARQDMAAFLYRVALFEAQTGEHKVNLAASKAIGGYSAHGQAVTWLAGAGITQGYPDGTFGGLLPVVRQDMAAFVHRADAFMAA